jgi:ppGpp synthetase/RelA/SpoT-type nucleotidyltranferase
MPLTKSQINKLGDELRHLDALGSIPEPLLVRLQEFRSRYDAPLVEAQTRIKNRLGLDTTSRLKTVNTIVEKLRREKTRLAEMQDVAGLRIVLGGGLVEQDALVVSLSELFPDAKLIDRRTKPTHGYRAVHLVPLVGGYLVEVQVRTRFQDLWAQAFERVADKAGRGIRYGVVPPEWADQIEALQWASEDVADSEILERDVPLGRERLKVLKTARRAASNQDVIRLLQMKQRHWEKKVVEIKEGIRAKLTAVIEGTEDLT